MAERLRKRIPAWSPQHAGIFFFVLKDAMQQEFSHQFTYRHYDPNRLLDTLQQRLGASNDHELAQRLHIARKTIDKIRSGSLQLSATLLLCMAECAATSMEELRAIVGDRRKTLRLPYRMAA